MFFWGRTVAHKKTSPVANGLNHETAAATFAITEYITAAKQKHYC